MPEEIRIFLTEGTSGQVVSLIIRVLIEILIFLVGTQVINIVRKIIKKTMTKANAEKGVTQFVDSFVKVSLYVLLIFMIASNLGMDAATIVALLGSAGVAIGLAIQGSLANLAGGVLILLTKPFKVGDYIHENSTHTEGTVTDIHIFFTKLQTPDNHVVVLPNGALANNSIVNFSAVRTRRVDFNIGISYTSDIAKAKDILMEVLKNDKDALPDLDMIVYVNDLKDSSVELGVRCFVDNVNYWTAKWRMMENCKIALDENGIAIPYPQIDVHMK